MILDWEFNGYPSWAPLYFTPEFKIPEQPQPCFLGRSSYLKGRNDQNLSTLQVDGLHPCLPGSFFQTQYNSFLFLWEDQGKGEERGKEHYSIAVVLETWSFGPTAKSASPEKLEIQILRLHSRPTELETLRWAQHLWSNQPSRWFRNMIKFEKQYYSRNHIESWSQGTEVSPTFTRVRHMVCFSLPIYPMR